MHPKENGIKIISLTRSAKIIVAEKAIDSDGKWFWFHEKEQIRMEKAAGCSIPRYLKVFFIFDALYNS